MNHLGKDFTSISIASDMAEMQKTQSVDIKNLHG